MFEALEAGRKVSRSEFEQEEPALRTAFLEVQREFRRRGIPLIVVIAGVEGAGKGRLIDRLREWLDARGLRTYGFLEERSDEERRRPPWWQYWRLLPPRGFIALIAGGWYREPLRDLACGRIQPAKFDGEMQRINHVEQMLTLDGALIVKFWMHLTRKEQKKVLADEKKGGWTSPYLKPEFENHDALISAAERAIRLTDTGECAWHLVAAGKRRARELSVGEILLAAMQERLQEQPAPATKAAVPPPAQTADAGRGGSILQRVDLTRKLAPDDYKVKLDKAQALMHRLAWQAYGKRRSVVALFEGWDAAGKGGTIRRLTRAVDARICNVISVAAPTDEERSRHYLWRFWRHLPRAGYMTIFDRSWYGRVLVERVEGFAAAAEWRRAYREINEFEEQLCESGILLFKFWLHLDADEQLRRFKEREVTPWKRHKLTDEDWRNREKSAAYATSVDNMVARTSTEYAPWHLIPANDKKYARVAVLNTICEGLAGTLKES